MRDEVRKRKARKGRGKESIVESKGRTTRK